MRTSLNGCSTPANANAIEEKKVMETSICMCTQRKFSDSRLRRPASLAGFALLAAGLFPFFGCSSTSPASKPQVGAIAFTDANATAQKPLTALTVSQGTYLDVALTSDPQFLGADWSVACGSVAAPGTPLPPGQTQDESCGTFTPAHTLSGPLPGYVTSATGYVAFYSAPAVPPKEGTVTLFASATSDHTKFSSVTLTINGLPVSVGFAPAPPATLGLNATTQFKAVVNNDPTNAGVNWKAICVSTACGSFNPGQTASGIETTYTAPATTPSGGTVQVTATSIADPTKSVSATIQIVPVSVSVAPAALSVGTAGIGSLLATVANDGSNRGVDWTLSCMNTTTPGNCGSITSHTASGAPAAYTAPSSADIAIGSTVVITATSTTASSASATSTVTIVKGSLVAGNAQAAERPISGAQVTLYAAATSEAVVNSSVMGNASALTTTRTGEDGSFSLPYGYVCPTPDTQMYLIAEGGNAGGGSNPSLALAAVLGSCSTLDASRFVVNEATTVAAIYALSGFITDAQHVGSSNASPAGMTAAFATAKDLVDVTTGLVRTRTVSGTGVVPQTKIHLLANLLRACAKTAGSAPGDGSPCDQLFHATNPGATPQTQPKNTLQALLHLAQNATGFPNNPGSFAALYQLAIANGSIEPLPSVEPSEWTLAVQFGSGLDVSPLAASQATSTNGLGTNRTHPSIDAAGNVWVPGAGSVMTEFVGASSSVGAPGTLIPIAASTGSTP
jgi:hypothetical protein